MKDDLISRKAAIDALADMYRDAEKWGQEADDDVIKARAESCMASLVEMKLRIEKLPSAQQVGKRLLRLLINTPTMMGHWMMTLPVYWKKYHLCVLRKKGTWLEKNIVRMDDELDDSNIIDEWQSARCSKCGKYHTTPFRYSFEHYAFCPHCGKPMKE